jgi:hypothetical protein
VQLDTCCGSVVLGLCWHVLGKERVFAFLDFRSLNISTKNKNDALVSKKNKNSHLAHSETPHRCRVQISSMKNESLVIMPASHCCCLLCANFVPRETRIGPSCLLGAAAASIHAVFLFCLQMRSIGMSCCCPILHCLPCSGLCLVACAIQQAKSTMASLPCVCLDPSQRLVSSIDLCDTQGVAPCDWSALF